MRKRLLTKKAIIRENKKSKIDKYSTSISFTLPFGSGLLGLSILSISTSKIMLIVLNPMTANERENIGSKKVTGGIDSFIIK